MFKNLSLIARLSLIFFAFTLVNILLFWLATGSNQMRLIAERASLEMHRNIMAVEGRLQAAVRADAAKQRVEFYSAAGANNFILGAFKNAKGENPPDLIEFCVVTNSNVVLLNWPETAKKTELNPDEVQNIIKTLRLREFSSETFFSAPDVMAYRLTVYIPFVSDRGQDLILRSVFSMESMRAELARLLRLGASIVVLLLFLQVGLGFFLYRLIVRPLKELRVASQITGRGEFHQIEGYANRRDEIGILVSTFNKMSTDIRDQKATIRKNYEEIKQRDETMQHELMIAQHIQKSIFPKGEYPHKHALQYEPLYAVSGDFYDVFKLSDGSTGYLICDASGHGVPAALLTMMAKSAFAGLTQTMTDPGQIMAAANKHISLSLELTGQYLTAFFARISGSGFEYCNATHPEPIILKTDGSVTRLKSNGFYVGMMTDTPFEFESAKADLPTGAKLILYTDGITEARNKKGELFGMDRLATIAKAFARQNCEETRVGILREFHTFIEGVPVDDDVTLLILEA